MPDNYKSQVFAISNRVKNMAIKLSGWVLLITGIAIIGWTLFSSYNIFTAKTAAPEIFVIEEKIEIAAPETEKGILNIQTQIEKIIDKKLDGIIPPNFMSKILNLIAWSIFAFILIFGGSQISILGIKLIKCR